jgi:hypothetical protein
LLQAFQLLQRVLQKFRMCSEDNTAG